MFGWRVWCHCLGAIAYTLVSQPPVWWRCINTKKKNPRKKIRPTSTNHRQKNSHFFSKEWLKITGKKLDNRNTFGVRSFYFWEINLKNETREKKQWPALSRQFVGSENFPSWQFQLEKNTVKKYDKNTQK